VGLARVVLAAGAGCEAEEVQACGEEKAGCEMSAHQSPPRGWRLLLSGEVLKKGDKVLLSDGWSLIQFCIGGTVYPSDGYFMPEGYYARKETKTSKSPKIQPYIELKKGDVILVGDEMNSKWNAKKLQVGQYSGTMNGWTSASSFAGEKVGPKENLWFRRANPDYVPTDPKAPRARTGSILRRAKKGTKT
jgi:hypothetical protein